MGYKWGYGCQPAARKAKGLPVGRKSVVSDKMQRDILKASSDGVTKTEIAKKFGIGRATVYRVLERSTA